MSLVGRLFSRLFNLPPAQTYDLMVTRDLPVPMRDGTLLRADHYVARGTLGAPVLLVRSPYGRSNVFAHVFARPFAERGFQVLIQSCRGTFGSGGTFNAFRHEQEDGLDTLVWMQQQPWYTGRVAMLGPSYLGQVQWALAAGAGSELAALSLLITASEFRSMIYPGESFALDTALTWISALAHQEQGMLRQVLQQKRRMQTIQEATMHLPLQDADVRVTGQPVPFYRDWLAHSAPDDPWWQAVDFRDAAHTLAVPALLVGGWYDLFLPHLLADYTRLRAAGRQPFLTIGPWAHASAAAVPVMVRESLSWLQAHLLDQPEHLRAMPVRVFVMGRNQWVSFADWPPQGYAPQRWFLQPDQALAPVPAVTSGAAGYRYDPADPTPAVGGSSLSQNAGPRDNRALEARADVLVYTSAPLTHDLEVIGAVHADLCFTSSREHTDVFVRLCDVAPNGRSVNICDGLIRLEPGRVVRHADGTLRVTVDLWPTAHCFRRGHRIRLQVAGGAHPRYARNPGSGEPLASATTLYAADHTVYHGPVHPSALVLPVRQR